MAEVKFLGFRQETLENYNKLSEAERKHYMWLIREFAAGVDIKTATPLSVAIYFGNRKYAETNQVDANLEKKVNAIITAIGGSVDENGKYQGFLPIAGDDILSDESVTTLTVALQKLSQAIKTNKDSISTVKQDVVDLKDKVGAEASGDTEATGIFAKIDDIEKKLDPTQEGSLAKDVKNIQEKVNTVSGSVSTIQEQIGHISGDTEGGAGILGDIEKLQKSGATKDEVKAVEDKLADYYKKAETYTQTEINEKLASLLRWKGSLENLVAIKAVDNPEIGDVYHSNEDGAEYVCINKETKEWELLGLSLDGYVTETALATKLADYATNENLTELSGATEGIKTTVGDTESGLVKDVADLQNKATRIVDNYQEAEGLKDLSAGQIIYAKTDYTAEPEEGEDSGKTYTAGAYLVTGVDAVTKKPSFLKIESSATGGQTPVDMITKVDNKVNDLSTVVNNNTTAITEIEKTHTVSGDDVEE